MEKEFFNDIVVVKRSGQRVNFNPTKVAIAIKKGFDSVYEDYDEKVQAKMQRYRDIPEDPGGLLRAFIAREYQKNRYNEE